MSKQGQKQESEKRPKWHPIRIKAAPKIGNVYWCRFHHVDHVCLPEMWKERPVIVVSHRELNLKGSCLVIPTSTDPQEQNTWSYKLPQYVTDALDGREMWAIYSHLITVSTSRFRQVDGHVPRLKQADLNTVITLIRDWLPSPKA